jgi:hypothetical protein
MRSLWERVPKRGECGKYAVRGIWIGVVFALVAVAATYLA